MSPPFIILQKLFVVIILDMSWYKNQKLFGALTSSNPNRPCQICSQLSRDQFYPLALSELFLSNCLILNLKVKVEWAVCNCSPPGYWCHSSGMDTEVGFHSFLQWIFPSQGMKLGRPHCRQTLYHLSHQGSLLIPTWLYSFSLNYLPTSLHLYASYSIAIIHLLGGSTDQLWQKSSMGLKMTMAIFFF